MTDLDLKNLNIYFAKRKIDVSHSKIKCLYTQTEIINFQEVIWVLELFQKGKFYEHIQHIQSISNDYSEIIIPKNN
ncbi:MAG TPA: hypothetical protein P5188_08190 [Flavobacterium sp.]|nr:hypothetical protein [Flavobacterium sp.]